jgi:hypothetical protein
MYTTEKQEETMILRDITNIRRAPHSMYRVIGYDRFDRSDYLVNDFDTQAEAETVARQKAAVPNAIPPSFSDKFFVFDDQGNCLEGFTYERAVQT